MTAPSTTDKLDMRVYAGEDYPRAGCNVTITVTRHGPAVVIHAPNGQVIESWGRVDNVTALRRLGYWLEGAASWPPPAVSRRNPR